MSQNEIGSEHAELSDLAEEFTARLRNGMPSHSVPLAGPPSDIGGVSLELTSESKRDDELEEEALDGNHSNHARQGLDKTEAFQEHHDNKEGEKHDDGNSVSNSSKNSTELLAAHAKEGTGTTSHGKETCQYTCIDCDGTEGHKCYTDQRVRLLDAGGSFLFRLFNTGLGVDEEVWNQGDSN